VRTFTREADVLLRITTEDGRGVEATPEHPFWVEGKGFIAAKHLARSDLLRDASGRSVQVVSVEAKPGRVRVYNFEVENTHTYYAEGWWVHNDCTGTAVGFWLANGKQGELWRLAWPMTLDGVKYPFHDVYRKGDLIFDQWHRNGTHINDYIDWFTKKHGPWNPESFFSWHQDPDMLRFGLYRHAYSKGMSMPNAVDFVKSHLGQPKPR